MQQLIDIIDEHNDLSKDLGICRSFYLDQLRLLVDPPEIVAILGLRRCGKSTIMQQLQLELTKTRCLSADTRFINFEDPRLEGLNTGVKLLELIEAYRKQQSVPKRMYFFLDEIDRVEGWEKALNFFYEQKVDVKFFISGSNSEIFTGQLATILSLSLIHI